MTATERLNRHNIYLTTVTRCRVEAGLCRVPYCPLPPVPGLVRCEMHRVIENTQQRDRRRSKRSSLMSPSAGRALSLGQAQFMLLGGAKFGDVYPLLSPDNEDRVLLKEWFVDSATPVPARSPSPTELLIAARDMGYTGDVCTHCNSHRMKRNGACQVCEDCGTQGGCG